MDVGSALKRARLARGLEIADLVELTRIRASLITAIEANDFDACGGEVFARGHVRTIASSLDLDPHPLLESMGAIGTPSVLAAVEPESLDIWELRSRAQIPSEARTWAVIAVTALVIVAALVWRVRAADASATLDPKTLPSVTSTATASVTPEPTPTATPSSTDTATPTAGATPSSTSTVTGGAIVLQLDCTETSWVRVVDGNGTIFQGTLRSGDSKSVSSDTDITVTIGNAAGITLTVNDLGFGSLGAPGAVFTHTFRVG
jgi:cytoskeleton protein RodZ